MIRTTDLIESFSGLIGWQPDYSIPISPVLSSEVSASSSGLYFNGVHPLLTLKNLSSIAPNFSSISVDLYSAEKAYVAKAIVSKDSNIYKATENVLVGEIPGVSSKWMPTSLFSEWLQGKTEGSIRKMIFAYYNDKLASKTHKTILENKALFDSTGRLVDTIVNNNNIVGLEINQVRSKSVTLKVNSITLQTDGTGTITLSIYHSSKYDPVKVLTLEKTQRGVQAFPQTDLYLPYEADGITAGGSYYMTYKQSELAGDNQKAINKAFDWTNGPCTTCSRRDYVSWAQWSKFLEITPFYAAETYQTGTDLWDVEKNIMSLDKNYGLNLDITLQCDITNMLIKQKDLFIDALSKQVAIDMLREFAYNANVRINANSINVGKTEILYELDGDSTSMKKSGLNYQLNEALKSVKIETEGLDRICLPCRNNGITYHSI